MSTPPMSDESPGILREKELLGKLGKVLYAHLPFECTRIVLGVRSLVPYGQASMNAYRADGSGEHLRVSSDAVDCAQELRASMYRENAGTWFSAEFSVTKEGAVDAAYNYDDEPNWSRPVEAIWYADDLKQFPRDPKHIPDWLQSQLVEAQDL